MIRISQIKLPCGHSARDLEEKILKALGLKHERAGLSYGIVRHSVDARKKPDLYDIYTVDVRVSGGPAGEKKLVRKARSRDVACVSPRSYRFPSPRAGEETERPVIVGAGPAGLFCALVLAGNGYRPLIIERGAPVEERIRDIEAFWKTGRLDPSSNVQFGEGGAGTFSDGKLNTGVNDREGRSEYILRVFQECGAPEDILYEAKPHVGSDYLRKLLPVLRARIEKAGGEFSFHTTLTGLVIEDGALKGLETDRGRIPASACVLCPGHSARDTFRMLLEAGVPMEQKNFAIGMRVSHPQSMIDRSQYGVWKKKDLERLSLPSAPYKLTARASSGRGVYSFCMCPGGYVVNASSEEGRLCVNGMSLHGRDSGRANSAIVMTVGREEFGSDHPLAGMALQEDLEEKAFAMAGGKIPVESYRAFRAHIEDPASEEPLVPEDLSLEEGSLKTCGQAAPGPLHSLLPRGLGLDFVEGMEAFDRKIRGFAGEEALVLGLESRTSSPVRILRGRDGQSPVRGLFPCGEGAGYAGGIMSAALDGIKTAEALAAVLGAEKE